MGMNVPRFFRITGYVFGGFAGILFIRAAGTAAVPAADFDVVGLLWLLQNLGRLSGYGFAMVFAGAAVACWIQTLRLSR